MQGSEIWIDLFALTNNMIEVDLSKYYTLGIRGRLIHPRENKWLIKVIIFWEGQKVFQNLHPTFDWHYIGQM